MKVKTTKDENLERIYLYHACLYLAKDEWVAQEMVQQTFLNFYEKAADVKPECERAYLIQSAKNLTLNYFRHAKFEIYQKDDEDGLLLEQATSNLEDDYLEEVMRETRKELCEEILNAVKEHNEEWYQILYSMFCLERNHDEIAEELGISKDILYSRLYRAKHWIRKNYEAKYKNVEDGA